MPRLRFALISVMVAGASCALRASPENAAPASDLVLWYEKPAAKWEEALPLGNGYMGAMVFGGTQAERIQFNEDTLWTGKPHDYARADAYTYLPEIRRLVAAGDEAAAAKLVKGHFLSVPLRQKAYQAFGDIWLTFLGHEAAVDYRRELDLGTAIVRTRYRVGDVWFCREVFASYPARAIVVRITADKKGAISFSAKLSSPHKSAKAENPADRVSTISGIVEEGGVRFEARLKVNTEGGSTTAGAEGLSIQNADSVTMVLVAATSFKNFRDISADPAELCSKRLTAVATKSYLELFEEHLADYTKLFGRVAVNLGRSAAADRSTDRRQRDLKTSGLENDPALAALYFQYGRYLLIASSRPGSQSANLQGVWNEKLDPPWESKWTTNINVEMNYWPAEVTNLSECHEPLFDLTADVAISGARTAKVQYNCGGWVLHHNTDLWRGTAPINNIDGVWPTGGAWLCHHLWEHYLFTRDKKFLSEKAYPLFKGASAFFLDYLVKDEKNGWLVTSPSFSPEQGGLCAGPTMDTQLMRALFNYTVEAAGILGLDREFAGRVSQARAQLPPDLIGRYGQLQEWMEDVDRPNNNHRHMSPLWAMYPGNDITPSKEKVFAAAKKLLEWRGDGSTGWSYAWRIPLWARAGNGDFAFGQLNQLLAKKTLPNLFDLCGPFQIDGNFGGCAGIAELLLQSHQVNAAGLPVIEVLPALPKVWESGSFKGLCARGGFEVDASWKDGQLSVVTLHSKQGGACMLKSGLHEIEVTTQAGGDYVFDQLLRKSSEKSR
ncbi:MAG: glycoside hydrolase family 95 protein [Nibricoccus sp.]